MPESIPDSTDMSAEELLSVADSLLIDECLEDALDMYTSALVVVRTPISRFRILSHRSSAFQALARYQEAFEDANEAAKLLPLAGLRTGESEAVARRQGVAAFRLERHNEAQSAFETAKQLATLNKRDAAKAYDDRIRKCREKTATTSSRAATESAATSTATTTTTASKPPPPPPAAATPATVVAPSRAQPAKAPKYQYYQSDKFMTVSILEPSVQPQDLTVQMDTQRLAVTLRKGGVDFPVISGQLYEEINVDNSKIQYKDEKVLIKLRKLRTYEWPELLGKETVKPPPKKATKTTKAAKITTPAAPTAEAPATTRARPYASRKDWDSIEKNLEAAEDNDEKPEGDEAMNKLFQQIYANADPDTRRAMIKSYQTSGGTVLSTNWGEVEKKNYEEERTAPKGMEWKTWEGDKLKKEED